VSLAWTISGGCPEDAGSIGGQFEGTISPQYWVIHIRAAPSYYIDHPQRPPGSQKCSFGLRYSMMLNGTAPDGLAVRQAFTNVDNVNLC
jgi:hypothetical protein